MAEWISPTALVTPLPEYVRSLHPTKTVETMMMGEKLTKLVIDPMTDLEMSALQTNLLTLYPGAF